MRIGLVACNIFEPEFEHLTKDDPDFVHKEYVEFALHAYPDEMREKLIEKVNALKGKVDAVLLGYAVCQSLGNFQESVDVPLVMFEGDDCICVFLGAKEYTNEKKICTGTWFSSPGWAREGINGIIKEMHLDSFEGVDPMVFMDMMFESYERCLYIDTGVEDKDGKYIAGSKDFANQLRLKHDERTCDLTAMENAIKKVKELAQSVSQ
ncbi:hypothetical protein Mpt1_c09000 [Candidatus Methanoplasma termitum]|uniref:DUF1638 domain-containing protein n=1 Tax=Candidatus Methanoplasma termitum TaxID=1577791 RepID=A0A0A7LGY7_9ARCH|nr:DUF1638 domain-containing protein [Candidatus Methanoplasma termitum]AIZ56776.1 hypothetical protein Mpt1_c09000 [Candidatus Methanoplasma termitum]MCL2333929.1 DUF1638 domain-containing protein [Candidatus Methanoplasma sp.]